jgi:two-component system sensor histidine kinase AlgZ
MVATVATELDVAKAYVRLEQERLGSRLQVNWDLTALDATVPMPPLMLQPLLENAVYHGIERLLEGGCVTVAGGSDGKLAWIEVVNPLPGSSIDVLNVDAGTAPAPMPSPSPVHAGHQEALANIRERLVLLYGDRGSLQTTASTAGFTARLCWPFTGNS